MRTVQSWMPAALSLALAACGSIESPTTAEFDLEASSSALQADTTKPTSTYYTVKRDQRRCASPGCGGYWISAVNQDRTTCADGKTAKQCYVADIELSQEILAENGDLVHGVLVSRPYPELDARLGVLTADFVLTPVLATNAIAGLYYLGYDTGIRCIRSPCPSFGLAALNTKQSWTDRGFAFDAASAEDETALQEAFLNELGQATSAGGGSVAFGVVRRRYDRVSRSYKRELAISNVYITKEAATHVCLVNTQGARTTAWNFGDRQQAEELAAGLDGDNEILDGRCGDAMIACTFNYLPVHGTIDAFGESCVEESNACAFRGAVIHAAGQDSKAAGAFTEGTCPVTPAPSCATDADCDQGFCGWDADDARLCRPWAQLGETCGGFRLPEYVRFCAPELFCRNSEPTGDAGGVCVTR